jgi:hypothetical protein
MAIPMHYEVELRELLYEADGTGGLRVTGSMWKPVRVFNKDTVPMVLTFDTFGAAQAYIGRKPAGCRSHGAGVGGWRARSMQHVQPCRIGEQTRRAMILAALALAGCATQPAYTPPPVQLSEAQIEDRCVVAFADKLRRANGIEASDGRLVAPPAGVTPQPNVKVVELSATSAGRPVIYQAVCMIAPDGRAYVSQG